VHSGKEGTTSGNLFEGEREGKKVIILLKELPIVGLGKKRKQGPLREKGGVVGHFYIIIIERKEGKKGKSIQHAFMGYFRERGDQIWGRGSIFRGRDIKGKEKRGGRDYLHRAIGRGPTPSISSNGGKDWGKSSLTQPWSRRKGRGGRESTTASTLLMGGVERGTIFHYDRKRRGGGVGLNKGRGGGLWILSHGEGGGGKGGERMIVAIASEPKKESQENIWAASAEKKKPRGIKKKKNGT